MNPQTNWREHGVRVMRGDQLDTNTPQSPGMSRAAAINFARAGAQKLWAGTVTIHPNAKTGAHHHGELESVIYVVSGRARMRWGDALDHPAPIAGTGRGSDRFGRGIGGGIGRGTGRGIRGDQCDLHPRRITTNQQRQRTQIAFRGGTDAAALPGTVQQQPPFARGELAARDALQPQLAQLRRGLQELAIVRGRNRLITRDVLVVERRQSEGKHRDREHREQRHAMARRFLRQLRCQDRYPR